LGEKESQNHQLHSVSFSPFKPCVFVVADQNGSAHFFDMQFQLSKPVFTFPIPPLDETLGINSHTSFFTSSTSADAPLSLNCHSFNPHHKHLIAFGDSAGRIHVGKLDWSLYNQTPTELQVFNRIVSVDDEEEGKRKT